MCATKRLSEAERKKEIMDSAIRVISEKGLGKTTMEEIIAGTTLSKGGVYHYYKSVNEIFKDIMLQGMNYRNQIIKEHLPECKKGEEEKFMAGQMVDKVIDDNPYMPLYIEFLLAKRRNPEWNDLMSELQEQTRESFHSIMRDIPKGISEPESFQFLTHLINALLLASEVLEARENFKKNRQRLEEIFLFILCQERGNENESL